MKKQKFIHFIGIKGVGMAPLAIIAKEAGFTVSGCDIDEEFITDISLKKAGIVPLVGFSKEHVQNCDVVITTGAHGGFDNPEVRFARELGKQVLTQGEAVGAFMEGKILGKEGLVGISVTGSHGKTTTTAMIATVLKVAGLDPSFVIGTGNVESLGSSGHFGKGAYFVAEADEYATEPTWDKTSKFLWQHPKHAVFTNIELDHPDVYKSIEELEQALLMFANQIKSDGVLIACGDDRSIQKILKQYSGRTITYGFSPVNDFVIKKVHQSLSSTFFWVETHTTSLGEFSIGVFGEHNGLNALSALIIGLEVGLNIDAIKKGLAAYKGCKRRAELVGELGSSVLLFDDYAHHPTEIRKTLKAFKQTYKDFEIICIFQPHTYSRTKTLFNDFIHAFSDADTLLLLDIYPSLREAKDKSISSRMLADAIRRYHKNVLYMPSFERSVEFVQKQDRGRKTVVITMGAGDVYKIGQKLKGKSQK